MKRLSQAPPSSPPGGLPTSPGMPTSPMAGGGGGAPGGPEEGAQPPAPTFKIIYSPLDNLGKIFADLDFKTYLQGNFGDDPDTLAHKIWVMYGGSEDEITPGKLGERQDTPTSSDPTSQDERQTQEYNATRNERWKRLPAGVSIDKITSTGAISMAIRGGYEALSKASAKPAEAFVEKWVRIANDADLKNNFKQADAVDKILRCLLT